MSTSALERCVALGELGVGISDQAQQSGAASLGLVHPEWCLADGGRGSEVAGGMGSTKREQVMVGKGLQHGLNWGWEESRGHVMQGWALGVFAVHCPWDCAWERWLQPGTQASREVGVAGPNQLWGFCRNPGERWGCWSYSVGGEIGEWTVDPIGNL